MKQWPINESILSKRIHCHLIKMHINHADMMKLDPRDFAVQQISKQLIKFRENDLQKFSYLCWIRVLDGNDV
jgi:hypothetical protein